MDHFLIHDYKQIDRDLKFILKSKKPLFIEVMTDTKQKIYDSFIDYQGLYETHKDTKRNI